MKKQIGISILLLSGLLITVASCDKDDDATQPVCRINNIVETGDNGTVSRVISYDEGKISSVVTAGGDGASKLFSYSSGMITIISKNKNGVVTGTDEVMLNQAGRIGSIIKKNAAGITTETNSYLYAGDGKLNTYIITPVIGKADTTKFLYSNGNATASSSDAETTLFDYYPDKTFLDGDFFKLSQMINSGALGLTNRNLLKSITSAQGAVSNFAYQYDNFGKITRMTISGATTANYTYTYDCK